MENFQLSDFSLNFEFDFQHDFTDNENRVIDDILSNPVESVGLFETDTSFGDRRTSSSSFFDYLCNDSTPTIDVASLENLSKSQLVPYNGNQVNHEEINYPAQPDGTAEQNVNFDWTTFLDESSNQANVIEDVSSSVPEQSMPNEFSDAGNVICDNGFVYQELKTLDVPQMYTNLDETFGLMDLKAVDESMDYSALVNDLKSDQNDQNTVNSNATSMKQKLFFLPMQLDQMGTEALLHVATKLKNHPFTLNSMLNKCIERNIQTKILIPKRPKQIKQKSDQYLTVNEQLEKIHTKEIVLPTIQPKPEQRKRKEVPKVDKEKVPVAYAFEVVLTNIMETRASSSSKGSSEANTKKGTKAKKVTTKATAPKRRTNNDDLLTESMSTRRSNKKIKTA